MRINSTNRAVPPKPKRTNEAFFTALAKGPFAAKATPPSPPPVDTGAVLGIAPLDGASIAIESDTVQRKVSTDGGGFFGALKLPPGDYRANECAFHVAAGEVARVTIPCRGAAVEASQ